jgi:hypothetical protein
MSDAHSITLSICHACRMRCSRLQRLSTVSLTHCHCSNITFAPSRTSGLRAGTEAACTPLTCGLLHRFGRPIYGLLRLRCAALRVALCRCCLYRSKSEVLCGACASSAAPGSAGNWHGRILEPDEFRGKSSVLPLPCLGGLAALP